MMVRVRSFEWEASPLGPIEGWPRSLKAYVDLILASPMAMIVLWGPDLVQIYNDGYRTVMAGKHPLGLGQPTRECWPEVWDFNAPIYEAVRTGKALSFARQKLTIGRHGEAEDAWFDLTYSPLRDDAGAIAGVLVSVVETTDYLLAERAREEAEAALRMTRARQETFLLELGDALRPLADAAEIQKAAVRILGEHLEADRAFYAVFDQAGGITVTHDYVRNGAASLVGTWAVADFASVIPAMRAGLPYVCDDVAASSSMTETERRKYADMSIRSLVTMTLVKEGREVAGLGVACSAPRSWSKADIRLVEETADRTWAAAERARAEAALRESEERYRTLFTHMDEGFYLAEAIFDDAGRCVDVFYLDENPAAVHMIGQSAKGRRLSDLGPYEQYWRDIFGHTARTAEPQRLENYAAPDDIWYDYYVFKPPEAGSCVFAVVFRDVTERRRAETALRESEERFRQFAEASSDVLWVRDSDSLDFEYLSPAFDAIYGLERDRTLGSGSLDRMLDVIVPEDREPTLAAIRHLREGNGRYECRIKRPSDGRVRWLRTTGFRLIEADGRVRRLGGITHDATEEKLAEDRLEILVSELQHRTRNMLAVIGSVANRTLRTSADLNEFHARFGDRLRALSRVNGLLSRLQDDGRITFDELIAAEFSGLGVYEPDETGAQILLRGPQGIKLRSATVQTLALAIHELATNAIKHGALSWPEGRLEVLWSLVDLNGAPHLCIEWRETGLPVPKNDENKLAGSGYGRELIERALPLQLGADTSYDLGPGGLECVVTLPVSSTYEAGNDP